MLYHITKTQSSESLFSLSFIHSFLWIYYSPVLCLGGQTVGIKTLSTFNAKTETEFEIAPFPYHVKFHLYDECLPVLDEFYKAAQKFMNCSIRASLPPRICMECPEHYAQMIAAFYTLQNDQTEVLGQPCSDIILNKYQFSYARLQYDFLRSQFWDKSECHGCIKLNGLYDGDPSNYTISYTQTTVTYLNKMESWRSCALNASKHSNSSDLICENCVPEYKSLYTFYWAQFAYPGDHDNFCLDITSTMNDTIYLWRSYYKCAHPVQPSEWSEVVLITVLSVWLGLCTALFYVTSVKYYKRTIGHTNNNDGGEVANRTGGSATTSAAGHN